MGPMKLLPPRTDGAGGGAATGLPLKALSDCGTCGSGTVRRFSSAWRSTSSWVDICVVTVINCPSRLMTRVMRSEEHTSELQSRQYLVCRLLLEKKQI